MLGGTLIAQSRIFTSTECVYVWTPDFKLILPSYITLILFTFSKNKIFVTQAIYGLKETQ